MLSSSVSLCPTTNTHCLMKFSRIYILHYLQNTLCVVLILLLCHITSQAHDADSDSTFLCEFSHDISVQHQIFNSQTVENSNNDLTVSVVNDNDLDSILDKDDSETDVADSLATERFSWKQVIVPGVLMGVGLLGSINEKNGVNKAVRDCMADWRGTHTTHIDDYLRFLPSAAYFGLGFISGVKARHNTRDRMLIAATSHASMLLLGYGFKFAIKERRPDMSDRKSFPSGHVSLAFTGAELMRMEYGTAYGIVGYAAAGAVAFLRLYNEKHWLHDVLMGAGIGILSARIGHWLLPFEHKLLRINDKSNKPFVAALPAYDPYHQAIGMSLVAQF